jgi:hypothetical protein
MVLKNGPRLLSIFLEELVNSAEKGGIITLIQKLRKLVGAMRRNGFFILIIEELETSGLR